MNKKCEACTHPQAEWRPGEPPIIGSVKEAVCCTIHGRGTCGSPLHVHYCPLHDAARDLLAALKRAHAVMCVEGENDLEEWQEVLATVEAAIAKAETHQNEQFDRKGN